MADVIIDREGGSGLGAGVILGILIAVLAIGFAIWYFGFGGMGHATTINVSPNINVAPPAVQVSAPAAT
jgi:hypothetical protein